MNLLSNTHKRIIIFVIAILVGWIIWQVNISLRNPCYSSAFSRCFLLSTTTFLIVYTPFEIYWSIRDLWFDRWTRLSFKYVEVSKIFIEVSDGLLSANIIKKNNLTDSFTKKAIIVIAHGFSDTKETLQYYYLPLVYQGYIVLTYDARGTGKSKKTGKRSDFLRRIDDFKNIIDWVKNQSEFSTLKIYSIGFSIGAITVLCGGIPNKDVEKIIAISSMSYYRQNIPKLNPLIMISYLIKRVKLFPTEEENRRLSPYLVMEALKNTLSQEEWKMISKKIMLIHSRNDRIIKYKNFKENKKISEIHENNLLIYKKGGHSLKKNEISLVGGTLHFLNS
ncbi:hypothetical protein LCGC14_0575170 [marine sediment metagenome]|uniref:Serine aminopeptidase S33 domain-containing protein n=1 Tax=marine sediment metagenome TaxID=412755 RepID=A0A0F9RN37_9ZZZZ|nr:MAG: short chain dehydrogenase [Candidatus Lokiarchaeum sp. GC14_75]